MLDIVHFIKMGVAIHKKVFLCQVFYWITTIHNYLDDGKHILSKCFGFQLSLPDDLMGSVVIVANALIFKASRKLSQFNVIGTDFNTTMDGSRISVDIKLRRIISYHLTNTFLPTITLLIIAEVIYNLENK
jgi:hypothetical protein